MIIILLWDITGPINMHLIILKLQMLYLSIRISYSYFSAITWISVKNAIKWLVIDIFHMMIYIRFRCIWFLMYFQNLFIKLLALRCISLWIYLFWGFFQVNRQFLRFVSGKRFGYIQNCFYVSLANQTRLSGCGGLSPSSEDHHNNI